ncbi:carbohydrate binding domain-containing protein [Enterococcus sp. N249-2]
MANKLIVKYLDPNTGKYEFATVADIGDLDKLKTTVKTDIVSAINSIQLTGTGNNDVLQEQLDEINKLLNEYGNNLTDEQKKIIEDLIGNISYNLEDRIKEVKDKVEEDRKTVAELITSVNSRFENAESDYIEKVNTINESLDDAKSSIVNAKIELENTKNKLNTIDLNYIAVEKNIDEINGVLSTKVDSTEFDLLDSTVTQNTTDLIQTKKDISLKANQESLDLVTDRVQKAEASLEITAGQIQQKVTYSEMQDELEKVGKYGKNLLKGTRNWKNWISSDLLKATVTINDYRHCKIAEFSTRNSYFEYILDEDIEVGETYVASINFKSEIEDNLVAVDFHEENNIYPLEEVVEDVSTLNGWKRMFVKFVATDPNPVVSFRFSFLPNGAVGYMSAPKLEKGSKATDWESNAEDDNNAIVEANSIIKQNADSIIQAVEKIEKNQDDIVETNSRIDITNENIKLQTQRIEDIGGEVKETKANLEITSNAIKTKVSQTDVDKSISDIHIDNKNRILNSDFSRDFENWNENGGFQLKKINDINYAYISRKGTTSENTVSVASDKFKVDYGARLIFGFDIFVENLSEYDIRTPIFLEIFDINDIRVDMQKFSLESLNGSIEQGVSSRLNGVYEIDREDASKARVRLCLNKNGSIGFSRIIFQAGDINSTDWSAAPEDSQIIQSKLETAIEQTVDQIKLSATKEELNKVTGKVEGSIAELKIASDSIETLVSNTKDNTTEISKLTQKSDEFSVLIGEMDEDLGIHENEIAELKISNNEINIGISSVQESLQDVENNVNRTQELVDKANNTILEMSKDTILSSIEKTTTSKEWSTIKSDYLLVKAQGEKYDVDINSLNAKYSALSSYITPILANMNSNSTIVPSTFQLNFKNYYDEKLNVLNKVNDKINKNIDIAKAESITASKTYTDSQISVKSDEINLGVKTVEEKTKKVSDDLSNLTIGGRNLLINTANPTATKLPSLIGSTPSIRESQSLSINDGAVRISKVANSTEEVYYRFMNTSASNMSGTPLVGGATYTLSLDVRANLTNSNKLKFRGQYTLATGSWVSLPEWDGSTFISGINGSTFTRVSSTFTLPQGATTLYFSLQMYDNTGTTPTNGNWFEFKNAKLEKGNKPTDWTPAPEDAKLYTAWSNDPNGKGMIRVYPNENLINLSTITLGKFVYWPGTDLTSNVSRAVTDYIPVKEGEQYTLSLSANDGFAFSFYLYKDNTSGISDLRYSGSAWQTPDTIGSTFDTPRTTLAIPTGYKYARVSFIKGSDTATTAEVMKAIQPKMELGAVQTPYTISPQDDPVKAEMAYIGYSAKDSNDPTDYKWNENPKAKGTFKRWSNDPNGLVDMTATYPRPNLIYNGKGNQKAGIFTNFDTVTDEYAEVSLTSAKTYVTRGMAEGFEIDVPDYEVGAKVTWTYEYMYTKWDMPTGTTIGELWMGQRYGSPVWSGVTRHNLPRVGTDGVALNTWYKNTVTLTIPAKAGTTSYNNVALQFYNSGTTTASFTIRLKNVKLEYGDTATPFISNQADNTPLDAVPQYVGIGSKDTMNPADFVWSENPRVAEISSEIANNSIIEMSKDTVLSAVEKSTIAKEWATIQSDYPLTKAQGTKYGVAVTTLNTTYTALSSYITPLLSNMTVNSDIVPATFQSTFKNYYDAKVTVVNGVNDVINKSVDTSKQEAINTSKTYTDAQIKIAKDSITLGVNELSENVTKVSTDLANLTVDGTNMIVDSTNVLHSKIAFSNATGTKTLVDETKSPTGKATKIRLSANTSTILFYLANGKNLADPTTKPLIAGEVYTLSMMIRATAGFTANGITINDATVVSHTFTQVTTTYQKVSVTFKPTVISSSATNQNIHFFANDLTKTVNNDIYVHSMQLEKGNIATGWNPAQEDINGSIITSLETAKTYTDAQIKVAKDSINIGVNETSEAVKSITTSISKLVNMFPDPDLKKQTPKPTVESGVTATYDASGLVISNTGATKARAYWGVAPISLTIGKTYTVKAYVNSGGSGDIEIGSAGGENISATTTNSNPFWLEGSIKCTNYTAFSIYVQAGKSFRIRELYVYEGSGVTNQEILNSFEASKTYADARIKLTKEAIDLNVKNVTNTVTKVGDDLSNLSIGGRNYITDTARVRSTNGNGGTNQVSADTMFYFSLPLKDFAKVGDTFTFSTTAEISGSGFAGSFFPQTAYNAWVSLTPVINVTKAETININRTLTITQEMLDVPITMIRIRCDNVPATVKIDFTKVMLSKGNKVLDWVPALEDAKLYTAWSNDPNGKDMVRVYPNENMVLKDKIGSYTPYNTKPIIENDGAFLTTTYIGTAKIFTISVGFTPKNTYYTVSGRMKINGVPVTKGAMSSNRANTYNSTSTVKTATVDNQGNFVYTEQYTGTSAWVFHTYIATLTANDIVTIENFKFEESEYPTVYTSSPKDNPVKAEMAYIGYSPKDSNDPADYVWSENPKAKGTFKRWSNDPNGLVDMTATYPNENLLEDSISMKDWSTTSTGVLTENAYLDTFNSRKNTKTIATQSGSAITVGQKTITELLEPSTTYTVSFVARGNYMRTYVYPSVNAKVTGSQGQSTSSADTAIDWTLSSDWQEYTYTFTTLSTLTGTKYLLFRLDNDSVNTNAEVARVKLEKSSSKTIYTSNQAERKLLSVPQYVGIGVKDTMNPADFVWTVSPEYTQALNEVSVKEVQFQLTPDSIYGMVGESSEFIAWQDVMASKPSIDDLMNVQDQLNGLSDADETILASVADLEIANNGVLTTLNTAVREMDGTLNTISDYMFFGKSSLTGTVGLTIGKSDSNMKVNIANDEMGFYDNETRIAWINSQQLNITSAVIQNDIKVGNHLIEKFNDAEQITIVRYMGS